MPGSQSRSPSILGRAVALPLHTRGGSRMRESRSYGSVRGARGETRVPTATWGRKEVRPQCVSVFVVQIRKPVRIQSPWHTLPQRWALFGPPQLLEGEDAAA